MWSPSVKQFWLHFFEVYKSHRCLWDVDAVEYMNRAKRKKAYAELIQLAKSVNANADHNFIRARINNVRTAYRKEVRKVLRARANGSVYKPKLFYFDLINSFLNHENNLNLDIKHTLTGNVNTITEEEDPFGSLASPGSNNDFQQIICTDPNADDTNMDHEEHNDDSSLADFEPIPMEKTREPLPSNNNHSNRNFLKSDMGDPDDKTVVTYVQQTQEKNSISPQYRKIKRTSKHLRKSNMKCYDEDFEESDLECEMPRKMQRCVDDECDILGKRFANHFRNMRPQQRLLAEKIISDVCIYARMDQLTMRSGLTIDIPNEFSNITQQSQNYCEEVIQSEEVDLVPESYIEAL